MQEGGQKQHDIWPTTNLFGWKWSGVSFIIILISVLFLVFIGPRKPAESVDSAVPAQPAAVDSSALETED